MIYEQFILGVFMAFILGLCFGSFLNVCIYRMPRGISVVHPGSMCPGCRKPIAPYDNIPLFSWFILRGRCRRCHMRITPRYWLVELLVAILFVACLYLEIGIVLPAIRDAIFCFLIVGLIFTDAETQLLPDKLTLTGFSIALVYSWFAVVPGFFTLFTQSETADWHLRLAWLGNSLLGAALGAGFIYFSGLAYKLIRGGEGMGFGDVKLMAMIGAFLGPGSTALTLVLACVAAALYGLWVLAAIYLQRQKRYARVLSTTAASARAWRASTLALRFLPIPFGVFLGMAALISLFFSDRIIHAYLSLFRIAA